MLYEELKGSKINIVAGMDKVVREFEDVLVISPNDDLPYCDAVIVTPVINEDIVGLLSSKGIKNIITLHNILNEIIF